MNVFLVIFALRNASRNYEDFFVNLRGNALQWWHYLPNVMIITTTLTLDEITQKLVVHVETTDALLVTTLGPENNGNLPGEAWTWINEVTGSTRSPTARTEPVLTPFARRSLPSLK